MNLTYLRKVMAVSAAVILVAVSCTNRDIDKSSGDRSSQDGITPPEIVQPYVDEEVHSPSIVKLPNGDLLASWFQGHGERWSDDVRIMGARKKQGKSTWSEPFLMADVNGFPDVNPVLFIDGKDRLWMVWYTVLANQWETSQVKYRLSEDYEKMEGAPNWNWQDVLYFKPGDDSPNGIMPDDAFVQSVERQLAAYSKAAPGLDTNGRWAMRVKNIIGKAKGEDMVKAIKVFPGEKDEGIKRGFPYFRRMGWQTRVKPFITAAGRIILPFYSDGFGFSMMAITDDWGDTWQFSDPLVGIGNIQPTIAQKASGELVAYMRDNGPAPKRLHISHSTDGGKTWSNVEDTDIPNPGSSADIVTLKNGHWVMIYNPLERGRNILRISLSEDEGQTWAWSRDIESEEAGRMSHYPAIIEDEVGVIHVAYSHFLPEGQPNRHAIKYAAITEDWIKQ